MEGADLSNIIWRRASRSGANGGECVELNGCRCGIAVRDSKDPEGPKLAMSAAVWRGFTRDVKAGRYDLT
jgi:hypothetical protein